MPWTKPHPDCESNESIPRYHRCGKTVARCHPCVDRMLRARDEREARKAAKKTRPRAEHPEEEAARISLAHRATEA
jgi:hypothetical protein